MKKIITLAVLVLVSILPLSAKLKFDGLNNCNHKTTIMVKETEPSKAMKVTDAIFYNFGDEGNMYKAKKIKCTIEKSNDGSNNAIITMTFKFLTQFSEEAYVKFNMNGKTERVYIYKDRK